MAALDSIDHLVVVMLENRSFDNMLGYLYPGGSSPLGHPFEGLDSSQSNTSGGSSVNVFAITADLENAYWYPLCPPAEGYTATNQQLFGMANSVPPTPPDATNGGFLDSFAAELQHPMDPPLAGAQLSSIMGMYTPQMLPVLSGLATGYAVCDLWFASVPSETMPNRAFAAAATSLGNAMNPRGSTKSFDTPSIFGSLSAAKVSWKMYGYQMQPYTQLDFPDALHAPPDNFKQFADFQQDAANGTLPSYAFLEPEWSKGGIALQNDQHPVSSVANGEAFIKAVYDAVRSGPNWDDTLLVITYDEHGGNYDHVPPPSTAVAPDASPSPQNFDFTRFGLRVPTVLVSPLIAAGTVFRAPGAGPPFDHTSLLATIEKKWGLSPLTKRDAAASDIEGVLTLSAPRSDPDPLAGVTTPAYVAPIGPNVAELGTRPTSYLQAHAHLVAGLPMGDDVARDPATAVGKLTTAQDYADFIDQRLAAWNARK
jgi:phospholipase C